MSEETHSQRIVPIGSGTRGPREPQGLAIRTEGLTKVYRRGIRRQVVHALTDLNLAVETGEVFGFLGQNGAGKSTTIKLLMGLIRPTSGKAHIGGAPVGTTRSFARIGYLPENPNPGRSATGREFLTTSAQLTGMSRTSARVDIDRLVTALGTDSFVTRPLRKLSKGQLQLVSLTHAFIGDPPILVLDEPMSGLDPLSRKRVRDLILDARGRGRTIFLSSHILSDVERLCDRVGLIREGHYEGARPVADLIDADAEGYDVVVAGVPRDVIRTWPGVSDTRDAGRHVVFTVASTHTQEVAEAIASIGGDIRSWTPRGGGLEAAVLGVIHAREHEEPARRESGGVA